MDPWTLGERKTWAQIWLTIRHLKDEAVERERLQAEAESAADKRNTRSGSGSGSGTQRETRRYSVSIKGR